MGKNLTSAEYGIVGTIITIINFGYLFLNNGVRQAVSREISLSAFNTIDIIKKGIIIQGGIVILAVSITLSGSYPLSNFMQDTSLSPYISMTAAIIPFMGIYFAMLGVFNGLKNFKIEATILIIYPVLKLCVIPLVYWGNHAVLDVEYGFLGAGVLIMCICIIGFFIIRPTLPAGNTKKIAWSVFLKESLSFSSIFIATSVIMNIDLLIVKSNVSQDAEVGYYTGAVNFAKIPYYLLTAVFLVLLPVISSYYSAGKIEEAKKATQNILITISATVVPIVVMVCCSAGKLLQVFYKPEYIQAGKALIYLMTGTFFLGMTVLLNMVISAINKKVFTTLLSMGMLLCDLTLCLILTPMKGFEGAAVSNLCATSIAFLLSLFYLTRHLGNIFDNKIVKNMVISLFFGLLLFLFVNHFEIRNIMQLTLLYGFVFTCQLVVETVLKTINIKELIKN